MSTYTLSAPAGALTRPRARRHRRERNLNEHIVGVEFAHKYARAPARAHDSARERARARRRIEFTTPTQWNANARSVVVVSTSWPFQDWRIIDPSLRGASPVQAPIGLRANMRPMVGGMRRGRTPSKPRPRTRATPSLITDIVHRHMRTPEMNSELGAAPLERRGLDWAATPNGDVSMA